MANEKYFPRWFKYHSRTVLGYIGEDIAQLYGDYNEPLLVGGFKVSNIFFFSPLFGEDEPILTNIFRLVCLTTNQFQRLVRDFSEAVLSKPYD